MNKKEVKVFDAYSVEDEEEKYYSDLGLDDYYLMEYHNCVLRKNGTIKPNDEILEFVNNKWLPYANRKLRQIAI